MLRPIFIVLLLYRDNQMLNLCYSDLAQLLLKVTLLVYT